MVSSLLLSLLLLARPVPAAAYAGSFPAAFLEDLAGSGEAEGSSASSPSLSPPGTPAFSPTPGDPQPTALDGPSPPTNLLDGIVDFFRQYVMLIAVVGSLTFLLMFIVCAALITRQKHKATAYYPSSFPKKKYVDQSDRAGGPQVFSEVPDRAADSRAEEPLDSSQQLQADILTATQNLRSPTRAAGAASGDEARRVVVEGGSGDQAPHNQEVTQQASACEGPADKPEIPEVSCMAVTPAAGEGQGSPEGSVSLPQEAQGPALSPQSPCACSHAAPNV